MSRPAIGIDLGTTYTVGAVYRYGNAEIILTSDDSHLIPSEVYFTKQNLTPIVGKTAFDQSLKCPRNYMLGLKRIIGRSYYDAYVQMYVEKGKNDIHAIKISNENETPFILLETDCKDIVPNTTPEDVASEILKYVKMSATTSLGYEPTEAVISVPAYFSYAQRAATQRAAEKAGFNVLKLIPEPVAAAIHYTKGRYERDQTFLLVDLGGGTLDVSIIRHSQKKFEVLSIESDTFLGGMDFDDVIFNSFKKQIAKSSTNQKILDATKIDGARFLSRLRKLATSYKHELSIMETPHSRLIFASNDEEYQVSLTRSEFETLSESLFKRIKNKVLKCLAAPKLSTSDIDKVVLVGGSTRIPKIKQILRDIFNGKEPCLCNKPDEAVALGTSIHAAVLKQNIEGLELYQINDIVPHSLGIQTKYDLMIEVIGKGTKLPAKSTQLMETSSNYQDSICFNIYEGERKQCKHNNKLGNILICGLPKAKAGELKFEVEFTLDESGLLRVTASETSSDIKEQFEIKMTSLVLCDRCPFYTTEEKQELTKDDEAYEKYYRLLITVDRYQHTLMSNMNNVGSKGKKDLVIKALNSFSKRVEKMHFKDFDALETEFDKLKKYLIELEYSAD